MTDTGDTLAPGTRLGELEIERVRGDLSGAGPVAGRVAGGEGSICRGTGGRG